MRLNCMLKKDVFYFLSRFQIYENQENNNIVTKKGTCQDGMLGYWSAGKEKVRFLDFENSDTVVTYK